VARKTKEKVLVLRTCRADMSSYNRFKWPESGYVEAPDWEPTDECGNGLHGWLWGEGDGSLGNWSFDAKWLVVEVDADRVIDLEGKVKFPSGNVVFCGDRKGATGYILERAPGKNVIGATVTAGDYGAATVGYRGEAVAGDFGYASAGEYGSAVAGFKGVAVVRDYGVAMAGSYGTATAGYHGRAIVGDYGIAMAERGGYVQAGLEGHLILKYFNDQGALRLRVAKVGAEGILPNITYQLDEQGNFIQGGAD